MVRDLDVAPQFAVFLRPDATSASRLARMLRDEPTVASVRELGDFERAAAYGTTGAEEWQAFRALYAAQDGTRAVYAFRAATSGTSHSAPRSWKRCGATTRR
ncbi:MAG: hypothetical protein R2862_11215 [Thermoanaerobaculia bacterium]